MYYRRHITNLVDADQCQKVIDIGDIMLKKINIDLLETYMIEKNIFSQNELALKAGLSPVTVSKAFRKQVVSVRTVKKIAEALNVGFFDIVRCKDE